MYRPVKLEILFCALRLIFRLWDMSPPFSLGLVPFDPHLACCADLNALASGIISVLFIEDLSLCAFNLPRITMAADAVIYHLPFDELLA